MRGGRCRYYSEAAVEDVSAPKHYYLLHPHTTSMTHEFRFKPISTFPVWLKKQTKKQQQRSPKAHDDTYISISQTLLQVSTGIIITTTHYSD